MGESPLNVGVLVSGRGSNLQALIEAVGQGRLRAAIRVVVSDVADAYALERARRHGIPALFVDPRGGGGRDGLESRIVDGLRGHGVELVAMAGYMRVVGPVLLGEYPGRIVNIHPSLLPAFPGLHVQKKALEHGVRFSGCTVHFADAGVDTGPVIIQAAVPVLDGDTEETLSARILSQEHRIYPVALQLIAEGRVSVQGRRVRVSGLAEGEGPAPIVYPPIDA